MAAYDGAVPMPQPVPTADGRGWIEIGDALVRCHRWIDGTAKENEETRSPEAASMGKIVAQLHGLAIPCAVSAERRVDVDAARWRQLAAAGRGRGSRWASRIEESVDRLARISSGPTPADLAGGELVGSHRDLNAHNVLFSEEGLYLIDWDAAGPAWPRWERVDFALRWAERGSDYDEAVLTAFLQGYLEAGGVLDSDDPRVVIAAPAALVPWVVQNVELAIDTPSDNQHELAAVLVEALLAMPGEVTTRQAVFARCLARL